MFLSVSITLLRLLVLEHGITIRDGLNGLDHNLIEKSVKTGWNVESIDPH